jgi:hypothetical protein
MTENTKLRISTDRDLKTDLTNSHKISIENENECIRYGILFSKKLLELIKIFKPVD